MRLLVLLLLGSLLLPAGLAGAEEPKLGADDGSFEKELNERYPVEFRARVAAAIDRGVAWLLTQQKPDGSWASAHNKGYPMGPTAFAALTLLKGGLRRDHPAIDKAFAYLRTLPMRKTYSVGVLLMALDARHARARDPFATEKVDKYGRSVRKDPCLSRISKEDAVWMKQAVDFLLENRTEKGVWRYPSKKQDFDLSCTQYALLGLKAAMRCGVKIPASVWLAALTYVLDFQKQDGPAVRLRANEARGDYRVVWTEQAKSRGFAYSHRLKATKGSMTTAGIACLIICQSELWNSRKFKGDVRLRTRVGIRDAMAWMQTWYTPFVNPVVGPDGKARHAGPPAIGGPNHYYYLYGLERAGIFGRARYFGEHDWYEEGAEILLPDQEPDGGWRPPNRVVESCFAILFLKRATSRMKVPVITAPAQDDAGGADAKGRSKPSKR